MLAAGLAGLGSLVRYVPNAVLAGFVNAVAVNIVLGQLSDSPGIDGQGANRIVRAWTPCARHVVPLADGGNRGRSPSS